MIHEYELPGDTSDEPPFYQVEPEASYWLRCPILRNVLLSEIQYELDDHFRQHPYPASDSVQGQGELAIIQERFDNREDPAALDQNELSDFLKNPRYFCCPPPGAILSHRNPCFGAPPILTGGELARLFEAETPGLWHRHVLNVFLDTPDDTGYAPRQTISPPRQALMWMALDTAIFSALTAVWHYKWLATGLDQVARRERPWEAEYPKNTSGKVDVLFDYHFNFNGNGDIVLGAPKTRPYPTPGSPRHPAYGSGHSTYSKAASDVLACLLPPAYANDFDLLAENIGQARIWGGVHWQTDHEAGQTIGELVGKKIIEQLNRSGIAAAPSQIVNAPDQEQLEDEATAFANDCGKGEEDFCATDLRSSVVGAQAQ